MKNNIRKGNLRDNIGPQFERQAKFVIVDKMFHTSHFISLNKKSPLNKDKFFNIMTY